MELTQLLPIPAAVIAHIRKAFAHVNDEVSKKISITPNIPEESLDIAFIEALSLFAGPTCINSDWAVKIATHFIGNIRHHRRYEIADIGIVVVFKRASLVIGRKLVLLQSKRLYPLSHQVEELEDFDYELGLGLITRFEKNEASIFSHVVYQFTEKSVYGAMTRGSNQCRAIAEHFEESNIPVHYMMYNPVVIPWRLSYPILPESIVIPRLKFGTRVISSSDVHNKLAALAPNASPSILDLSESRSGHDHKFGSSLEDFSEEVIRCREGYIFSAPKDEGIRRLFSRKSGPIYCVIEVTIETSKGLRI